jgi:hypothetical protein
MLIEMALHVFAVMSPQVVPEDCAALIAILSLDLIEKLDDICF